MVKWMLQKEKLLRLDLNQNIALQEEVKFYKELLSLSESAEQKICSINKDTGEETGADKVLQMIKQARSDWEYES
ncbi:MAG: hypothetical protein WKG06_24655 [Segetibacter sp.]